MFTNQTTEAKKHEITNWVTALILVAAMLIAASCGGGGAALPVPQGADSPAPGTADLSGQLIQAGGDRVASEAGMGLPDVFVTLIDTLTGGKLGTDITDSLGKFEFEGVPSGDNYLIKLEFKSAEDLDGDGRQDKIELFFPVSLADQAITELLQEIGVTDSDGDGTLDALEVEVKLTDDGGRIETSRSQHRHRSGETRVDEDGDGSFDDEQGFDDSDSDGLPDAASPTDSSNSGSAPLELEVRGVIEELTEEIIMVGGVKFALNAATEWEIGELRVTWAEFSAGMFVKVEGLPDGNDGWVAHEVETEDETSGDDNGGDRPRGEEREVRGVIEELTETSVTVAGVTFALNAGTEWEVNELPGSQADFSVGMFVKVDGNADGEGGWIAREVETEDASSGNSGDDSETGDDESGDEEDEDEDEDNSGSGSDDDEEEDDEDEEEEDDDNSGSGSDD